MLTLFLAGARDQRLVRIDGDDADLRIVGRCGRPSGGEVERLAEQHDQVGAANEIGEGAERGVGDAARAFHDDGGHAGRGFEVFQHGAARNAGKLRAGDDERPRGAGDGVEDVVRGGGGERNMRARVRLRPRHCALVDPRVQQVRRQADMHRSRPPCGRDADGLGDVMAERFGRRCRPRRLGDGLGHVGLAQLLEAAAAELPGRGVAGQQHHRQFRAERGEQRADRVGVSRPAGDQCDAGLSGEAAVGVRHVHRSGLVAHMDEVEAGIEGGVEDRHDVIAGQREDAARAEPAQRLGDDVGASQHGHVALSVAVNLEGASTGCQRTPA